MRIDRRSAWSQPAPRRVWLNIEAYGAVFESVAKMSIDNQGTSFRGLPLTYEQDCEIRHYIHLKERKGERWDTPELQAMLADMLDPPEVIDEDVHAKEHSIAAERMTADGEESLDTEILRSRRQ